MCCCARDALFLFFIPRGSIPPELSCFQCSPFSSGTGLGGEASRMAVKFLLLFHLLLLFHSPLILIFMSKNQFL